MRPATKDIMDFKSISRETVEVRQWSKTSVMVNRPEPAAGAAYVRHRRKPSIVVSSRAAFPV
jgi:hypothetical protein